MMASESKYRLAINPSASDGAIYCPFCGHRLAGIANYITPKIKLTINCVICGRKSTISHNGKEVVVVAGKTVNKRLIEVYKKNEVKTERKTAEKDEG